MSYEMQRKICESHVCIIGVGGTGSYLALAAVMTGVEKITIVDFDEIELSNTSRQVLYDESDVGKRKVDVAKEKLEKYNRNVKVNAINVKIENEEDMQFLKNDIPNLAILCADTPRGKIQSIVDRVMQKFSIPWFLYGPYSHSKVSVGPLIVPGKTKTYEELFPKSIEIYNDKVKNINQKFVAAICDPYNGFASQFAAIEMFKILSGYTNSAILNKKYYVDTDTWEIEFDEYD